MNHKKLDFDDFENYFNDSNIDEDIKEKNLIKFYNFMMMEKYDIFPDKIKLTSLENNKKEFFRTVNRWKFSEYCKNNKINTIEDFFNHSLDNVLKQNQNTQKMENDDYKNNREIFLNCVQIFFDRKLSFVQAVKKTIEEIYMKRKEGNFNFFSFTVLVMYFFIKIVLHGKNDKNYIKNKIKNTYLSTYFFNKDNKYEQNIDKFASNIFDNTDEYFDQ